LTFGPFWQPVKATSTRSTARSTNQFLRIRTPLSN
jgi:hypothetical protein